MSGVFSLLFASQLLISTVGFPLTSMELSSNYGLRRHPVLKREIFHSGIDLRASIGTPIRAVASGRVVFAGDYAQYGKLVVLSHVQGLTTHYAHCKNIGVSVGQVVHVGEFLGQVGRSGRTTGPHLHFELRHNGKALNPILLFSGIK